MKERREILAKRKKLQKSTTITDVLIKNASYKLKEEQQQAEDIRALGRNAAISDALKESR